MSNFTQLHTTMLLHAEAVINTTVSPVPKTKARNETVQLILLICYGVLIQCINMFGIVTNIINVICFVRQGLKDAVNVSLLALAIADIGCLVTMIMTALCLTPQFQETGLPFDSADINYFTAGIPHVIFTRVTSSITALIMVERCLCITMPLKVKNIFNAKRVAIIIGSIYAFLIASVSPIYCESTFTWKLDTQRNKTILGMASTENRIFVEQISFGITNIFVPYSALIIIIICMITITIALVRQAKWRQKCSVSGTGTEISKSDRDQRVAKMVVMISTLFVVCFTPSGIIFILYITVPGFTYYGEYHDIAILSYSFCAVLESTNSSTNIFIYYRMSSKYRSCFQQLLGKMPSCTRSSGSQEVQKK